MRIVRSIDELHGALDPLRTGSWVGLVPTMGAFHDGHLSLFRAARAECDTVVVSLFVNPAQFAEGEDLARYPRDEARDTLLAEQEGIDVLFVPPVEELGNELEGEFRAGHFRGVATVCLKLFNLVRPDVAYFGQKDAQQAALLRRMVRDLNLELELRVLPTVRDDDGLALSSRNSYLSADERRRALALPRALATGRDAFSQGSDPVQAARGALNGLAADYIDVVDLGDAKVLAAAARVGPIRLIDNVVLEGELT